jgi:ATP-dependent DNA helicase RecQ
VTRDVEADLRRAAEEVFGWSELRPDQLDAMRHLVAGRDVLVVMPTGAGKSAIYQVSGVLLDGPTVVVSPLIALQHDQVRSLRESEAPDAVAINSAQPERDNREAWEAVRRGKTEYLFLTPEQLASDEVVDRLAEVRPSLFVVDEAHCVSAWGHGFRPDYLRLGGVIDRLGHPRVLAMTATAGEPVREDVVRHLAMRDPEVVVAGFDRPELHLEVRFCTSAEEKRRAVVDLVADLDGCGLVYAATRKDTETLAEALTGRGVRAAAFHAGMRAAERERVHEDFLHDRVDVVVATSAFGMGIDKPDVRFVVHVSAPGSLDAYYQEIGRAGRDGLPARVVLFHRPEDLGLQRFFTSRSPDDDALRRVAALVCDRREALRLADLHEEVDLPKRRVTTAVNLLQEAGVLLPGRAGLLRCADGATCDEAVDEAVRTAERQRSLDRSRVEVVRSYAEARTCRRHLLLGYFGEESPAECGACDVCEQGGRRDDVVAEPGDDVDFPFDASVRHDRWGAGKVVHRESDRVTVLFDDVGYRTLSLEAVRDSGVLVMAG